MKEKIKDAVIGNINWFLNSNIMAPVDGSWGVGERIIVLKNNNVIQATYKQFPFYTEHDNYSVLEQRRPDCNFELATLFLLAGEKFKNNDYKNIGMNIINYLYRKSGLQATDSNKDHWFWSNPSLQEIFWFDDNGWIAAFEIFLGKRYPELNDKYNMLESGLNLAKALSVGMERSIDSKLEIKHGIHPDPEKYYWGEIRQPHWGTPVCVALLLAGMHEQVLDYHKRLDELLLTQSISEYCYALISSSLGYLKTKNEFFCEQTDRLLEHIFQYFDFESGKLASQHCEAPSGENLIDLIYTTNWFFLGLTLAVKFSKDKRTKIALEKITELLIKIQDKSTDNALNGCWRGMFDMEKNQWGGGDLVEGGANSIYSGWTNAPISLGLLSLIDEN